MKRYRLNILEEGTNKKLLDDYFYNNKDASDFAKKWIADKDVKAWYNIQDVYDNFEE